MRGHAVGQEGCGVSGQAGAKRAVTRAVGRAVWDEGASRFDSDGK